MGRKKYQHHYFFEALEKNNNHFNRYRVVSQVGRTMQKRTLLVTGILFALIILCVVLFSWSTVLYNKQKNIIDTVQGYGCLINTINESATSSHCKVTRINVTISISGNAVNYDYVSDEWCRSINPFITFYEGETRTCYLVIKEDDTKSADQSFIIEKLYWSVYSKSQMNGLIAAIVVFGLAFLGIVTSLACYIGIKSRSQQGASYSHAFA